MVNKTKKPEKTKTKKARQVTDFEYDLVSLILKYNLAPLEGALLLRNTAFWIEEAWLTEELPKREKLSITPVVEVRERPILFTSPMVRAILDGTKTQTRRLVKRQPVAGDRIVWDKYLGRFQVGQLRDSENAWRDIRCPYGKPGDRLWVRETWMHGGNPAVGYARQYKADGYVVPGLGDFEGERWIPGIHMFRWASRITLEITGVRVERLQEISEADARDEGCEFTDELTGCSDDLAYYRDVYRVLWDSINHKKAPWSSNPFVWVLNFKPVEKVD